MVYGEHISSRCLHRGTGMGLMDVKWTDTDCRIPPAIRRVWYCGIWMGHALQSSPTRRVGISRCKAFVMLGGRASIQPTVGERASKHPGVGKERVTAGLK